MKELYYCSGKLYNVVGVEPLFVVLFEDARLICHIEAELYWIIFAAKVRTISANWCSGEEEYPKHSRCQWPTTWLVAASYVLLVLTQLGRGHNTF